MIGLDTNVLVRYLVQDDKAQAAAATRLIEGGDTFLINTIVLCELVWVLESCYGIKRKGIHQVIEKILSTRQLAVENSDLAWKALDDFIHTEADFSDCLLGIINQTQGCKHTVSFDRDTKKLTSFQVLASR